MYIEDILNVIQDLDGAGLAVTDLEMIEQELVVLGFEHEDERELEEDE
jgi:hypothetical protein